MIARVRDYASAEEAMQEWRELGIEGVNYLPSAGEEFVFVEGVDEEILEALADMNEGVEGVYRCEDVSRALLVISRNWFKESQAEGISPLNIIGEAVDRYHSPVRPGVRLGDVLSLQKTGVMGILNVTPDSFSDGGEFFERGDAVSRAFEMVDEGGDIIDIGGESTRPFSDPVTEEEEAERVIPVIEEIAPSLNVPISIDTRKPEVARKAVEAGAGIINDVSGLRDEGMMKTVAELDVPAIVMHMRGTPETMQVDIHYDDVVGDLIAYLGERIEEALEHGVREDNIVIDPGIGFGKTLENNLEILSRLREFRCLGRPVLIGTSRKSFIGEDLEEDDRRLVGSLATVAVSIMKGAQIVRVHDVAESVRVCRMVDSILKVR